MDFMTILRLFAGPIGGLVNKGIGIGSTAALTWMIAKGVPADAAGSIVSGLVLAASTAISAAARTQGVQIDRINSLPNGVTVVPAAEASSKGVQPVNSPLQ